MESQEMHSCQVFVQRAKELYERRLVSTSLSQLRFTISCDAASQILKQSAPKIDEEDLRSFLLTFRHFVSDNEPAFINRIFNLCDQHLQNDYYRGELRKARQEWRSCFEKMGPIAVTINQKQLTGEFLLDLWINGVYFHNDNEKGDELNRLLGASSYLVRMKFLETLSSLTQVIFYVSSVVDYGLREDVFIFPNG